MNKKSFIIAGLAALMLLPTSCRENEFGSIDLTMPETPVDPDVTATYTFNHPCAMYTAEDFARVKAELDGNTIPEVTQAFAALKSSPYSSLTREPEPKELVMRMPCAMQLPLIRQPLSGNSLVTRLMPRSPFRL